MNARHLYHDHDTGHTYWLDGGSLLAAPVDRHGVVDLTDAYDVDMFRVDDVARVHRIAAQLAAAEAEAAESAARLSDPGGHVEVIPSGGGSRADRPLVDDLSTGLDRRRITTYGLDRTVRHLDAGGTA